MGIFFPFLTDPLIESKHFIKNKRYLMLNISHVIFLLYKITRKNLFKCERGSFFPITWLKVMFQVRFLYQVLHQVCSFILFSQNKMTFHKVHHSRASTAYALIYEIGSSKNHCIFSIVHLQIVNFSFYFFGKCIMYTDKKKL